MNKKKLLILFFWILVWAGLARLVHNPFVLVGPVETLKALVSLGAGGDFWLSILHTILYIVSGLLAGSLFGILLAALSVRYAAFRDFVHPILALIKSIPVVSFVILLLIWTGSRTLSLWISALVVLPILYFNVEEGLSAADTKMLEMAQVFRMPFWARVRAVYLPTLAPFLKSAFTLALGMCWKSGVAAEVIGQPLGTIGNGLYRSKINLDTASLFAWTLTLILISWIFEKAFTKLLDKVLPDR